MFSNLSNNLYVIAEMSGNHNGDIRHAKKIIHAAKESGADAIKIQTYTPDTITLNCDNDFFKVKGGTAWDGLTLYELYKQASTPWEWHAELKEEAEKLKLDFFSTPFDATSVDFLESLNVKLYKISSFELIDIPLLKKVANTGKPVILSTGMATEPEIEEAISTLYDNGCKECVLLKCTSSYPALPNQMNLNTLKYFKDKFNCCVGLSDHSLNLAVPVTAVALGARVIEKHLCINRNEHGVDSSFSLQPNEFKEMVDAIKNTIDSLGEISFELTESERNSRMFRKSLWVSEDICKGDIITNKNVKCLRPGNGLHPRYLDKIYGREFSKDCKKGTPIDWSMIRDNKI